MAGDTETGWVIKTADGQYLTWGSFRTVLSKAYVYQHKPDPQLLRRPGWHAVQVEWIRQATREV